MDMAQNQNLRCLLIQLAECDAQPVMQILFTPRRSNLCRSVQNLLIVALRRVTPPGSKDIQPDIHRGPIEITPGVGDDFRGQFSTAKSQEQRLDDVLGIREIARNPIRRPVDELVVILEQCLKFLRQRLGFQPFARCNRHEVLVLVTPELSFLLHDDPQGYEQKCGRGYGRIHNSIRILVK
jgi:hypothetical protein